MVKFSEKKSMLENFPRTSLSLTDNWQKAKMLTENWHLYSPSPIQTFIDYFVVGFFIPVSGSPYLCFCSSLLISPENPLFNKRFISRESSLNMLFQTSALYTQIK